MKTIPNIIYTAFTLFGFTCFALTTVAQAENPNQRVIPVNLQEAQQCAGGGDVIVRGNLVVTFEHSKVGIVKADSVKLEDFSGTAVTGNRQLEAKHLRLSTGLNFSTTEKKSTFSVEFKVTGPGLPGGAPLCILVRYGKNVYTYHQGEVTTMIPDDSPIFKCRTASQCERQ